MKLYHSFGMNPRMLRMFLLEKDIRIDLEEVDILSADNRKPAFLDKNPYGQTPVLELDDGSFLSESAAICEYLEEKFDNGTTLLGATPEERAETRMWRRRVEINICVPMIHAFYYKEGYELFKTRVHCLPEAADGLKEKAQRALAELNDQLEAKQWIAGDRFTIADICLYTYMDQLRSAGQPLDESLRNVKAWFDRVAARPSADASVWPEQPMGMRG